MPTVEFKTTKIAERAEKDPLLYEALRDIGLSGNSLALQADGLAAQLNSALARLTAVEGRTAPKMRALEFTSGTTTFTTGSGVTEVWVTGCGAGAGGSGRRTGGTYGAGGGGGGGDSCYRKRLVVTASTGYSVTIGAGGNAGVDAAGAPTAATAGGNTTFGALLTLTGGAIGAASTTVAGGAGGAGGGPGGQAGTNGEAAIATYETDPLPGIGGFSFPGSWGAGGHGSSSGGTAKAGHSGYLLVEWNE